jgi:hypothetical protein
LNFFPNLYIVLVSQPGRCRKGTAIGFGVDFLVKLNIKLSADSITRESLIRKIRGGYDTDIDPNTGSMTSHSSYTIVSPELTVFLGHHNYQLLMDLTDWFDCGKGPDGIWEYSTKGKGEDRIIGIWINLLGATTPQLISSALPLDAIGGGLTSRIIFIYANKQRIAPIPHLSERQLKLRDMLYHDLEIIRMLNGNFTVSDDFIERWIEWYSHQAEHPPFTDSSLSKYCTRRGTHVMKLSMVMNACRTSDMHLTAQDLNKAIETLEGAEPFMPNVFRSVGASPYAQITAEIMQEVGIEGRITYKDLYMRHLHDVADSSVFDAILKSLERVGFLQVTQMKGTTYVTKC